MKVLIKSFQSWRTHEPFTQSAAAAYYAVFSLPGLLIIIMAVAALLFDQQRVEDAVLDYITNILGTDAAKSVHNIVADTQVGGRDSWAMITGLATLLFGATGLFVQLQKTLNHIWEVEIKKSTPLMHFILARATALGIILAIGFLMMISLTLTTLLTLLGDWIALQISPLWAEGLAWINSVFSFVTITFLFSLIFRVLPDAHVEWKHALRGGILSAVLFNIGEFLINFYFESAEPQSAFGAAGSVVLLMMWVSYSCLILLLGAEYAKNYGEAECGHKAKATAIAKKNSTKKKKPTAPSSRHLLEASRL